jgi:hypothetical protein
MKLAFWCSVFFGFLCFVSFVFGLSSFSFSFSFFVCLFVCLFLCFFLVVSIYLSLSLFLACLDPTDPAGMKNTFRICTCVRTLREHKKLFEEHETPTGTENPKQGTFQPKEGAGNTLQQGTINTGMVQTTPGNVKHFQGREANREQKTPIRQQKACSPKAKASIPDRLSSLVKDSSSDGSAASRVSEMRLRGSCLMYVQDREMSASCASPTPATSDSTSDDAVGSLLALGTAVDTAATDLDSSSSESWSSCPAWGCIMPIIGAPIGSPISII